MKFPNWFRILWWLALIGMIGWFLVRRLPNLISGKATAFDVLTLLIFFCLSLAPIFSEITLLGITLKQQLETVSQKVDAVKAEIHNSLSFRSQINPSFNFSIPPPPDSRLPEIEDQAQRAIENALQTAGKPVDSIPQKIDVPSPNIELFEVRFNIDRELGRIWRERFGIPNDWPDRPLTTQMAIQRLVES
jgi:hypothetical protein